MKLILTHPKQSSPAIVWFYINNRGELMSTMTKEWS